MSSESNKLTAVTQEQFFTDPSFVATLSNEELKQHIEKTRNQLASTLDQVEVKANPTYQYEQAKARMKRRLVTMKREQPLALAAIGVGAAAIAGVIIFAVIKGSSRR